MPIERGVQTAIETGLRHLPVVVLEGGRAVGKSTLCRLLSERHGWQSFVDLTDADQLAQLRLDPERFLADLPGPVVIDEAQLEPQLLLAVKRIVDRRGGAPGQFLITGSARLGRAELGGSDPLAGRAIVTRLWSLTERERAGSTEPLAELLFADEPFRSTTGRAIDQPSRWWRGGLPAIPGVLREADDPTWERALAAYVEAVLPLGAGVSRVDLGRLLRSFRYLAANPGQQLVLSRMASELGIKADTARSHLEVLEAAFLVFRAEAHRPSEHKVLTAHPRVFASDTGLAAWALGLGLREPNPLERGALMENRIAVELASTLDWSAERIVMRHWRDQRSKHEVDLLLVHPDGRNVAIEVKASSTVGPGDTRGLLAFAAANRGALHRTFVIYDGDRVVDLTPAGLPHRSVLAVPVAALLAAGT